LVIEHSTIHELAEEQQINELTTYHFLPLLIPCPLRQFIYLKRPV